MCKGGLITSEKLHFFLNFTTGFYKKCVSEWKVSFWGATLLVYLRILAMYEAKSVNPFSAEPFLLNWPAGWQRVNEIFLCNLC